VRLRVMANRRSASHARVAGRERLPRGSEHHLSASSFFEPTVRSGLYVGKMKRRRRGRVVEAMLCSSVLRELDVLPRLSQPVHVLAAGRDRQPVIGATVEDPDRPRTHLSIVDIGADTDRIEGHVGGKLEPRGACMRWNRVRLAYRAPRDISHRVTAGVLEHSWR
jgi:hypothetical protein